MCSSGVTAPYWEHETPEVLEHLYYTLTEICLFITISPTEVLIDC